MTKYGEEKRIIYSRTVSVGYVKEEVKQLIMGYANTAN